ncbi:RlpA-like double-psi beta-barrel-protein domain-containing protein-containing protein [Russula vinacea]|nr:RlpA-like double-psi beta-barrel-protein domain-containing protein-containing protein [Russula vinacea]
MYKLTFILFTFFSLVLPILAVPTPVPENFDGLEKRTVGKGTWYYPGLGNCGETNSASELVVAISSQIYDNGAHCLKQVQISYGGQSVNAIIVDSCPTCGQDDLDMSPATFKKLAPLSQGDIEINWEYL